MASRASSRKSLHEPLKLVDRARSAEPGEKQYNFLYQDPDYFNEYLNRHGGENDVKVFGHSTVHSSDLEELVRQTELLGAPSRSSVRGSARSRHTAQSAKRSQSARRSPQTPQSTTQSSRSKTTYNRPWLQNAATGVDKAEARQRKESAAWWKNEAQRMTDVISKLKTSKGELVEDLERAKKTVRHHKYELGVAQAALDRQSEQAVAADEKRIQLKEEVNRLREEKEQCNSEADEKKAEVVRLREKAKNLEDQVAELQKQKGKCADKISARRLEEKRQLSLEHIAEEKRLPSAAVSPNRKNFSRRASESPTGSQSLGSYTKSPPNRRASDFHKNAVEEEPWLYKYQEAAAAPQRKSLVKEPQRRSSVKSPSSPVKSPSRVSFRA